MLGTFTELQQQHAQVQEVKTTFRVLEQPGGDPIANRLNSVNSLNSLPILTLDCRSVVGACIATPPIGLVPFTVHAHVLS